jgi:hypothetical protein
MKTTTTSYSSVHGTLHCVFFMGWLKTAFDYPSELNGKALDVWRREQPIYGEIACSWSEGMAS